jgi:hypothetical protein
MEIVLDTFKFRDPHFARPGHPAAGHINVKLIINALTNLISLVFIRQWVTACNPWSDSLLIGPPWRDRHRRDLEGSLARATRTNLCRRLRTAGSYVV